MLRWFNFRVARVLPFVDFTASLHSPWSMGRRLAAVHTMIFPEIKQRPWQAALDQVGSLSVCLGHQASSVSLAITILFSPKQIASTAIFPCASRKT
jgi:hypothetical protein